jgi:molecular chaperone GrpE (heat shock protein)
MRLREERQRNERIEAEKEIMRKRKEKERQQIKFRNDNFMKQKLAAVDEVRRQKESMKHNLYGMREENYNQAQFRKQ